MTKYEGRDACVRPWNNAKEGAQMPFGDELRAVAGLDAVEKGTMVGEAGFEPATTSTQSSCTTGLCDSPVKRGSS